MMAKTIDPTERALDAYFELDSDQRATFNMTVKHVERQIGPYTVSLATSTPPRGRPKGSKNRAKANPLAPESFEPAALFARNGAVTEDL